jgi:FixJ family two-component response regulator
MARAATVLVIDDDADLADTLRHALERAGRIVLTAATGSSAIRYLSSSRIDVVIADLSLPDLSGERLLQYLRDKHPGVPVIVLTGHATIDLAVSALRLGVRDFLQKPISLAHFVQCIDGVLKEHIAEFNEIDTDTPVVHYAARQWAAVVIRVVSAPFDPVTLSEWGRIAGASPGTIKRRCSAIRTTSKNCRDFARVLRAVVQSNSSGLPSHAFLNADPRTLRALSASAGLALDVQAQGGDTHPGDSHRCNVAATHFIANQHFVLHAQALAALQSLLTPALSHPRAFVSSDQVHI